MMTVNPQIAALLQAKLAQQAGAPAGAPVDPSMVDPSMAAPLAPAPYATTDPNAVAGMLDPLAQAQAADQANLADGQAQAAQVAMQDVLSRLASRPNPEAWAAQVGPGGPVSAPVSPTEAMPDGTAY